MSLTKPDLIPYLEKYGSHCMAYTSLEPSMEYFLEDGVGYIAYISFKHWFWARKGRKVVLADPICDKSNTKKLVSLFIKKYSDVIFLEASKDLAQVLDALGYQVNKFGIETEIPLADFNLKGKHRAKLRQWRNKCQREGVIVREQNIEACKNIDEINTLSSSWLDKKGGKEYSFLVRPLRYKNDRDARYFWAYKNDKLIGFAVFDPLYKNNKVVAYYHNIDRIAESAPHGTSASIILEAIEVFREEGIEMLSLGMSPMFIPNGLKNEFNFHPFTRKAFRYAFDKLNFLYPFKGNFGHKKKFGGEQYPIYFSSTNGTALKEVFVMMKAVDMF